MSLMGHGARLANAEFDAHQERQRELNEIKAEFVRGSEKTAAEHLELQRGLKAAARARHPEWFE